MTQELEEDWDAEPDCPPQPPPPGAWLVSTSQGNEWMAMAIQDPIEDSISGDSGVGTVKTVVKTEPGINEEELVRATGGIEGSDLEWTPSIPLIEIKDENVTRPSPAASLIPIQPPVETEMLLPPESPGNKKLCL